MNLTTDKWIPVVWEDGRADKVSLLAVFQQGDQIRDLSVRPHERIALMRLLICIAQAALDGPKNQEEWKTCQARLPAAAAMYLAKWKHAFEMFGDGQRFLQVNNVLVAKELADDELSSPSKLDFALATGNSTTLFDNAGGSQRIFCPDILAIQLLTHQNFSPGGLIGDVQWNGIAMGRTSNHSPCVVKAMLHAYVVQGLLLKTVCANLISAEQVNILNCEWGAPIWEKMPDGPKAIENVKNATQTYLGRLVPMSRVVKLSRDGRSMVMGAAFPYDPKWRETAATIVIRERNGNPERVILNASLVKSVWREAHSMAVLSAANSQMLGGPVALMSRNKAESVDLWCGALVANKAKLLDAFESVLHIPASMFSDTGQRLYQQGVQQAESWGRRINHAVSVCHRELHDDLDKAEFRKRGNVVKQRATSHYWTAIEQKVPLLLALIENPEPLSPDGASKENWGATDWGKALARTARSAYELACPHETPRQLKAYSLGLSVFFKPVESEAPETSTEEIEE